jgi:cytochrome c biogenesis factor
MSVDGHALRPRIVVYPDRGGRLAEVAVHTGPVTDVHVTLETANDNESIVVTVHRRHGMWLVWLGAALVTVATLASALGPRRG